MNVRGYILLLHYWLHCALSNIFSLVYELYPGRLINDYMLSCCSSFYWILTVYTVIFKWYMIPYFHYLQELYIYKKYPRGFGHCSCCWAANERSRYVSQLDLQFCMTRSPFQLLLYIFFFFQPWPCWFLLIMVYRLFTEFRAKWLSNVASICTRFDISFLRMLQNLITGSLTEIS